MKPGGEAEASPPVHELSGFNSITLKTYINNKIHLGFTAICYSLC